MRYTFSFPFHRSVNKCFVTLSPLMEMNSLINQWSSQNSNPCLLGYRCWTFFFFCSISVVQSWMNELTPHPSISSPTQVDSNTDLIWLLWEIFGDNPQQGLRLGLVTKWISGIGGGKVGAVECSRGLWWNLRQVLYQTWDPKGEWDTQRSNFEGGK